MERSDGTFVRGFIGSFIGSLVRLIVHTLYFPVRALVLMEQ